jgi:hypothetical protein
MATGVNPQIFLPSAKGKSAIITVALRCDF